MKASALEFRLRTIIMTLILGVGMAAPWVDASKRISLLEWLALEVSRLGLLSFAAATPTVIILAALIALQAAVLRVWGTAWLGPATVLSPSMTAHFVVADGPYRHLRNPLYLGLWLMTVALTFIMPPTGALLVLIAVPLFLLRLILGEEAFLAGKLGEQYALYKRAVPRLFPRLRTNLPPSGRKPRWLRALLSELTPIGVFITFATLSWGYNNQWMLRAILVSFGISLLVRGLLPRDENASRNAEK